MSAILTYYVCVYTRICTYTYMHMFFLKCIFTVLVEADMVFILMSRLEIASHSNVLPADDGFSE